MPNFPAGDQFGNATPTVQTGGVNTSGTTQHFQALEQLGNIGAGLAMQVDNNQRRLKASSLTTQAAMELQEVVFNLKTDRDYDTQFDRYTQAAQDIDKRYQKQFDGDERSYSMFKRNFTEMAFKHGFEVRSQALNGQLDLQKGQLMLNMADLAQLAVQGDEEQREAIKARADDLLEENYHGGVIEAEEAAQMHLKFRDDMTSAQVRYDILTDPDQAATDLLAGKYDLSEERAMQWLEKANSESESRQRARFAAEDRARRERERFEKQVAEDTAKEGDQLLFTGNLTTQWLEENREQMDESDYRYFYKSIGTGSTGFTDINIYSSLRQRASDGEDVREEARQYLRRGMLKLPDYEKLVNRSEQNTGAGDVPNWFKRGEDYLSRAFRVSDVNPDPSAPQRLANVMDEWTQWSLENPSPSQAEARQAYQEIAKSYALLDSSDMILLKPLPRYVVGNRQNMDMDASMQATVDAFQNGDLTPDEFKKQAALLKEWEAAMQKMRGEADAN